MFYPKKTMNFFKCHFLSLKLHKTTFLRFWGKGTNNYSIASIFDLNVGAGTASFRSSSPEVPRDLGKRLKPEAICKCPKEKFEKLFRKLSELDLDHLSAEKVKNKKISIFEKLPLSEIGSDPKYLDNFPK